MKIKTMIAVAITPFLLSGCFKSEAPKCSDPAVKGLVKDLYTESLQKLSSNPMAAMFMGALPKEIVSISAVRPVAYDEKVNLRSCKAEAHFDNNVTANIEYTVQLSEENPEEFYVELDTAFMEGLMQQSMMQGIFETK
ncbi:MAG: hypothetical protein ABGW85_07025 [Sulfurimonas sp.]